MALFVFGDVTPKKSSPHDVARRCCLSCQSFVSQHKATIRYNQGHVSRLLVRHSELNNSRQGCCWHACIHPQNHDHSGLIQLRSVVRPPARRAGQTVWSGTVFYL
jgi:hypothetical protein